ncbi:hypothetical protein D3C80_846270 [compost metagenome]
MAESLSATCERLDANQNVVRGKLLDHGAAPHQNDPANDASYFVKLQTSQGERTIWGKELKQLMEQTPFQVGDRIRLQDHGMERVEVDRRSADSNVVELKPAEHRIWTVRPDGPAIEQATVSSKAEQVQPRQAEPLRLVPESPALSSIIRGELLEHGAAPYQHDPSKDTSYFVKLQTPDQGERTLWGKDFEQLMQQGQFKPGEQIRLQDHGTQAVDVVHQNADGSADTKVAQRRTWTVEREEVAIDHQRPTPATSADPVLSERKLPDSTVAELAQQFGGPVQRESLVSSTSARDTRDTRLSGDKILTVAGALREAGFDREADVFAEAVFKPERWPDALANLRALAKNPAQACPDAPMPAKEVAHRMYESVERDLYKTGVDYQTVADAGRALEPSRGRDRDMEP